MDQDNKKRQKYIHTHMTLQPGVAKEEKPSFDVAMHEGLNGISYTLTHIYETKA